MDHEHREWLIGVLSAWANGATPEEQLKLANVIGEPSPPPQIQIEGRGRISQDAARNIQQVVQQAIDQGEARTRDALFAGYELAIWLLSYAADRTGVPATQIVQELALHLAAKDQM